MNSLSSLELTQISREADRIALGLLTEAVDHFVMPALKINASKNGRPQPRALQFVSYPQPSPVHRGYQEAEFKIAMIAKSCQRGHLSNIGCLIVRGNQVSVILRGDTTGTSARLSWGVTAEGKPTIPNTRDNRHALKRLLALTLA